MIQLYGDPMRSSIKVPVVFDAGTTIGFSGLKATVSINGNYTITEEDLDGFGGVTETRVYTGIIAGSTNYTIARIPFSPRYLNSSSAYFVAPEMDTFSAVRHPRWLFPSLASGEGLDSAMALVTAVIWWNDTGPFSHTNNDDAENLAITVTRDTTPGRGGSYDDHLSKSYHDTLGAIFRLTSSRGKVLWDPAALVNVGTDYPATGSINQETYRYDIVTPFPSAGVQELITDIHRAELLGEQTVVIDQPAQPDEATDFFTKTYDDWSMVFTWKLQAV